MLYQTESSLKTFLSYLGMLDLAKGQKVGKWIFHEKECTHIFLTAFGLVLTSPKRAIKSIFGGQDSTYPYQNIIQYHRKDTTILIGIGRGPFLGNKFRSDITTCITTLLFVFIHFSFLSFVLSCVNISLFNHSLSPLLLA